MGTNRQMHMPGGMSNEGRHKIKTSERSIATLKNALVPYRPLARYTIPTLDAGL